MIQKHMRRSGKFFALMLTLLFILSACPILSVSAQGVYLAEETFESGKLSSAWEVMDNRAAGNYTEIVSAPGYDMTPQEDNLCLRLTKTSENSNEGAKFNITPQGGVVAVEVDVMVPVSGDLSHFPQLRDSQGRSFVHIMPITNSFYAHDGNVGQAGIVAPFIENVWYFFTIVVDFNNACYDYYVDGQKVASQYGFTDKMDVTDLAAIEFTPRGKGGSSYEFYVDNLRVYDVEANEGLLEENLAQKAQEAEVKEAAAAERLGFKTVTPPLQSRMEDAVILFRDSAYAYVDGKRSNMNLSGNSVKPQMLGNILYLPARFVLENMNTAVYEENGGFRVVSETGLFTITEGSETVTKNGKEISLGGAVTRIDGELYLPASGVEQLLAGKVFVDSRGLIAVTKAENAFSAASDKEIIEELIRLFPAAEENAGPVFYVSPDGDDSFSGTLPERSADGNDGPFLTPERAKLAVREAIAGEVKGDVYVYFRGGKYYLDQPLTFTEQDSGKEKYRIIYKNYEDEKPELIGGTKVTGWEPAGGNIYRAKLETAETFSVIAENGQLAVKARTPNTGYFFAVEESPNGFGTADPWKTADDPSRNEIMISAGDFTANFDPEGTEAFVWAGEGDWNWYSDTREVSYVNVKAGIIGLKPSAGYKIGKNARYYIQGAKEFLDAPGEFYYDQDEGYLYYYPKNLPIEEQEIVVPFSTRVLELKGSSQSKTVQNIEFNGLTFRVSDAIKTYIVPLDNDDDLSARQGLIYLENAENNVIRFCEITAAGSSGIMLNHCAQGNLLYGNRIEDVGFNGIYLAGWYELEGDNVNRYNMIQNNSITNGGKLIGHGTGVQLLFSGSNEISYNYISGFPRYGVSIKGYPAGGKERTSGNNIIRFNDISQVMLDSQDGGAIESWNPGPGNIFDNNRIHDFKTEAVGGVIGIYMDDESHVASITNNVIYGINQRSGYGIFVKSRDGLVKNNVVADNMITTDTSWVGGTGTTVENNIFYTPEGDSISVYNGDKQHIFDKNVYFHPDGNYNVTGFVQNYDEWRAAENNRFDQNSVIADPLFVDPGSRNYNVLPESPAAKLGFQKIDLYSIGLGTDFPHKAEDFMEAEKYDAVSGAENLETTVAFTKDGQWTKYSEIDFGEGGNFVFDANVAAMEDGAKLELRLDSADGETVGVLSVTNTGGIGNYERQWTSAQIPAGKHDIYFRLSGAVPCRVESFRFYADSANPFAKDIQKPEKTLEEAGILKNVYLGSGKPIEFYVEAQGLQTPVEVRLDSPEGTVCATLDPAAKSGDSICTVITGVDGVHDLYFVENGALSGIQVTDFYAENNLIDGFTEITLRRSSERNVEPTEKGSAICSDTSVLRFDNVYLGNGEAVQFNVMAESYSGNGTVELRKGSPDGEVIASVALKDSDEPTQFIKNSKFAGEMGGVSDVYLTFSGFGENSCNIRSFSLKSAKVRSAREQIRGIDYDKMSGVMMTDALGSLDGGDWSMYANVDFGSGVSVMNASLGCEMPWAGGYIDIRIDSLDGPSIGKMYVRDTGSFNTFELHSTEVSEVSGIHDLYFLYSQTGTGNLMWFQFE